MGRNLEAATIPLHDVVVADRPFVKKAADALQVGRSGSPSFLGLARSAAEASVVVGQETAQDLVGGRKLSGSSQTQFAGKTILKGASEAFDAALGLGRVGGDAGNTQLRKRAAELGRLSFTRELFFHRPVLIVAHEDAVTIAVEAERDAIATQQAAQQAKIAAGIIAEEELGDENFTSGVIQEAEQGQLRAPIFQPVMKTGIQKQPLAFPSARQAALAMPGGTTFARGADSGGAQQPTESLATERKAFQFTELLAEMAIVEARITSSCQLQDASTRAYGQTTWAGPAAADVCQSGCAALPIASFETLDMPA